MESLTEQFQVLKIPNTNNACFRCQSEGCWNCVYYGMPCLNCKNYCIPWSDYISGSEADDESEESDESDNEAEYSRVYPVPRSRTPEI